VINSSRSERGWQGRRRIAVLVSIAGVLGIVALGSASSASAAAVANCRAKLEKSGKSTTSAKLSFSCDAPIRTYSVGGNQQIKSYGASSASILTCEGTGVGFGCGILDRAAPGTQVPGTTGWEAAPPPPNAGGSNQTDTPTTCNGYKRTQGGGTPNPGPNLTTIVTPTCTQVVPAGTKITQTLNFKSSVCAGGKNPLKLNLMVGGEPAVTSFIDPTMAGPGGESTTAGEYLQAPAPVNLKAFKGCSSGSGGGGKKSSAPATHYPVSCSGTVTPQAATPGDSTLAFSCTQNVRSFAVYSNVPIDLPGDEPLVSGTSGGGANEGALQQCEGAFPGPGYGCGTVDRQAQTALLPNGNTLSGGNSASQTIGFDSTPCKRKGQPKPKTYLVVMGEPNTSATTVGEFSSQPFPLAMSGYKCKGGKKK
jgi:hypothetical protein